MQGAKSLPESDKEQIAIYQNGVCKIPRKITVFSIWYNTLQKEQKNSS
jgi:hypothetical protein